MGCRRRLRNRMRPHWRDDLVPSRLGDPRLFRFADLQLDDLRRAHRHDDPCKGENGNQSDVDAEREDLVQALQGLNDEAEETERRCVELAGSFDGKKTAILERELGYTFNKPELLIQALTRRSYANEHSKEKTKTSEPLSFLGDAVLDLAVSEHLVSENPELTEGQLTNRFQGLASELQCAAAGTRLRLYNYLRLGGGEKPLAQTANFMAEAYEALMGALFLDGLYGSASAAVKKTLLKPSMSNRKEKRD